MLEIEEKGLDASFTREALNDSPICRIGTKVVRIALIHANRSLSFHENTDAIPVTGSGIVGAEEILKVEIVCSLYLGFYTIMDKKNFTFLCEDKYGSN